MADDPRLQFKFMIPASLKAKLEDAAHDNRRSLSAEIVARLEESLAQGTSRVPPLWAKELRGVVDRMVQDALIERGVKRK